MHLIEYFHSLVLVYFLVDVAVVDPSFGRLEALIMITCVYLVLLCELLSKVKGLSGEHLSTD